MWLPRRLIHLCFVTIYGILVASEFASHCSLRTVFATAENRLIIRPFSAVAELDCSVGATSEEIVMTLNKGVEDDQLGQYYRRTMAIADRLGKSLPCIHDGEFGQLGFPVEAKPTPLFSVIATTVLDDGSVISTLAASRGWMFAEAVMAVLGYNKSSMCIACMDLLIARGHTMTDAQVEEMTEKTNGGIDTKTCTNGDLNLFFQETGDSKCSVSVCYARRDGLVWGTNGDRSDASNHLLVRNLDASKL